jgi:hypothetical protein
MLKFMLIALGLLLFTSVSVFAAGFQLKSIGGLDVTGSVSKEWWYTSANPTLSGMTTVGSAVTVTIDSVDYPANVDGSGNWSYNPTTLTEGDHVVNLTSPAGSQSFTLHIGNVPADVTVPVQPSTPVVGSTGQTLVLWLGGALVLVAGIAFLPWQSSANN